MKTSAPSSPSGSAIIVLLVVGLLAMTVAVPPYLKAYYWKAHVSGWIALALLLAYLPGASKARASLRLPSAYPWVLGFIAWGFISSLHTGTIEQARWQLLSWFAGMVVWFVGAQLMTWKRAEGLARVFVYGMLGNLLFALLVHRQGWEVVMRSLNHAGSFGDKNYLAEGVAVVLPFALYQLMRARDVSERMLWGLSALALVGHAVWGGSKSGTLAVGTELCVFSFWWAARIRNSGRRPWTIPLAACGLILAGLWLGLEVRLNWGLEDNAHRMLESRIDIWKTSFAIFRDHPWFGIGSHHFLWSYAEYDQTGSIFLHFLHAHNELLHLLVEFGILGLSLLVIGFLAFAKNVCVAWNQAEAANRERIVFLVLLPLAGIALQGLFNRPAHWTFSPFAAGLIASFVPAASTFQGRFFLRTKLLVLPLVALVFAGLWGSSLDVRGLWHRGRAVVALDQKDPKRAIEEAEQAMRLTPRDEKSPFLLARACKLDGQPHQAIRYYERCHEIFPHHAGFTSNLAYLWAQLGDHAIAEAYLEKIRRDHPLAPELAVIEAEIESLRNHPAGNPEGNH